MGTNDNTNDNTTNDNNTESNTQKAFVLAPYYCKHIFVVVGHPGFYTVSRVGFDSGMDIWVYTYDDWRN